MNSVFSYEDAKDILLNQKHQMLRSRLTDLYCNYDAIVDLLLNGVNAAIQGAPICEGDKLMGSGDDKILSAIIIALPYYFFDAECQNADEYSLALISMCKNYYSIYNQESGVIKVIEPVSKLIEFSNLSQRLVFVMHYLIAKAEKLNAQFDKTELGISQQFLKSIMGTELDF